MSARVAPGQRLVLRTDGASRGNPGPAAAGVVIEREDGQVIARGGHFLGSMTSNRAEYHALIAGLRAVARYQPSAVTVCLDSELVVRQMNGRYKVRHPDLNPLYEQARALARDLPDVRFIHAPRAVNHLADSLANAALDAQRAGARHMDPNGEG
jgi:probable phosphoglycerate mutase